jgi:hypothetical protein
MLAGFGAWMEYRGRKKTEGTTPVDEFAAELGDDGEAPSVHIDDDAAAEIIRKARPALERAAETDRAVNVPV